MILQLFKNKKVFLTGHTGFKGTWLLHVLHHAGAKVKGYALPALAPSLFVKTNAHLLCEHTEHDIRHKENLVNELLSFEPDFVFHMAAQPLVLESYHDPVYTFEVNQMGTVYLLEAIRQLSKPCVCIVITTDKVYQDQHKLTGYVETDTLGGFDPYSASKAGCELIVESYRNSFFHPGKYADHTKSIATARAGNVIGGGDYAANRLVPDIVRALEADKEVVIRHPAAVRPWQHVLDALFGYLTLAKSMYHQPDSTLYNSAWNFGPHKEDMWPVAQVAEKAIQFYGKGQMQIEKKVDAPKETGLLTLDISKSLLHLPWQPRWDAAQAIQKTVEWYQRSFQQPDHLRAFTHQQIEEFFG